MKLTQSLLATSALLLVLVTSKIEGQTPQVSMKSAMSQTEYAASGIGGLRQEQQLLIDRWLTRWTSTALSLSRGGNYLSTDRRHYIEDNLDGKILILDDNSIWLVESTDRVDSGLWLAISDVIVTKDRNGVAGFNYQIRNTDDKETVHAKYLGDD